MRLVSSHLSGSRNVGDAVSSPSRYFDFGAPVEVVRYGYPIESCDAVIFGGGAIGNHVAAAASQVRAKHRIAWGLGETRHGQLTGRPAPAGFSLFGSRDWQQPGAEWVPCASCMSPLFGDVAAPKHEEVLYYNRRRRRPSIAGLPSAHNEVEFAAAVEFLASGSIVVTNSYHGVYWATLLGRGVIVVDPYSSKLFQLRHRPAYGTASDWRTAVPAAVRYSEALTEARAANTAFYGRVMELLAA